MYGSAEKGNQLFSLLSLSPRLPPSLAPLALAECMAFLYEDLGFLWSSKFPPPRPPRSDVHTAESRHIHSRDAAIMIMYKAVT